jgi:tetratricopeptide (TPR) repeat protein
MARNFPATPVSSDLEDIAIDIPQITLAASSLKGLLKDKDLIVPFACLAYFNEGRSFYSEAQQWWESCLEAARYRFGKNSPDVVSGLINLGSCLRKQGSFSQAEVLLLEATAIMTSLVGDEHPDVATCLYSLGLVYQNQGRYSDAESCYRRSLAIRQYHLDQPHPHLAQSLNALGIKCQLLWRVASIRLAG